MIDKVDVAVNVYGKPYHTLVSILSLLKHSGDRIDKIFLVEEARHPHGDGIGHILKYLPKEKIVHVKSKYFIDYAPVNYSRMRDNEYRHSIRYQYAFEKTEKEYLLIMHNDVLFRSDAIGSMMDKINGTEYVGIGMIGMCWCCPANYAGVCDGDRYDKYNPTYEEAIKIVDKYPSPRTTRRNINKERPMPFPECRLNEFFALINTRILRPLIIPIGSIKPIGDTGLDTGTEFFRSLFMKGYRFINYNGIGEVKHAWISGAGHPSDSDKNEYERIEKIAKEYLFANLIN